MDKQKRKIAVIGGGSSGMATAAYFAKLGYPVVLCDTPEHTEDFPQIRRQGGILLRGGSGQCGCAMPELTENFEQALRADRVLLCVPHNRHEEISRLCAPLARPGQVFLFSPGNFGSFFLRNKLDALGKTDTLVGELAGNLWACRRTAPAEVIVSGPLKTAHVAALPSGQTDALIRALSDFLPAKAGKNVLEVSLNSPNVISHLAGAVLNGTQIERMGERFAFFRDGLGETAIGLFSALEKERAALFAALGFSEYSPPSEGLMRRLLDTSCHDVDIFRSLDGPSSFAHRYVSEDASCGVAMLVSLGEACGVSMPLTEAFLRICGAINGTDYLQTGRTLRNLALPSDVSELMRTL